MRVRNVIGQGECVLPGRSLKRSCPSFTRVVEWEYGFEDEDNVLR